MLGNSEYTYTQLRYVSIGHSENACLLDMNHLYYKRKTLHNRFQLVAFPAFYRGVICGKCVTNKVRLLLLTLVSAREGEGFAGISGVTH